MNFDERILREIDYYHTRRDKIRNNLNAPNLAFAIMKRVNHQYHEKIGEKVHLFGFLVRRNNRYYVEIPPKEFLGYYPEIDRPLSILTSFETDSHPPIGYLTSFTGTLQARPDKSFIIRRNSQIFVEKYLSVEDWDHDYTDVYLECPIKLSEIVGMIHEQLNPEPPLDLALLFSPISAPPVFNTMGGVSSVLSGLDFKSADLLQIGKFLQNLVPSWHHSFGSMGFHMPLYPDLTPKVSILLRNRKNYRLEFCPLVTRVGEIDLDKERGFFHLDDPLVLTKGTVTYNETYKECEEFRPEIQWSFMRAHLQLQHIDDSLFPPNFNTQYESWIRQMCEEFKLFKALHVLDPVSLYDIRGRRGSIIRLIAAYSRLKEAPIDNSITMKIFNIARRLFADFDTAHGYKLLEYDGDISSPTFGLSQSKKLRNFRESVFDLLLSYDYITQNQMEIEAKKLGLTDKQFESVFQEMYNAGDIYDSGGGRFKALDKHR